MAQSECSLIQEGFKTRINAQVDPNPCRISQYRESHLADCYNCDEGRFSGLDAMEYGP